MTDIPLPLEGFVVPEPDPTLTLDERFDQFHAANPWVLNALLALAESAKAHGETKLGVKALVERLRWSHSRSTVGDSWRLNNSLTSRYARAMIDARPELADLIETRKLRAA